jgi:hypothetical protein
MPKFNQEHYEAYDQKAKDVLRNYLDEKGIYSRIQEDYGPDIKSVQEVFHEVEIKNSWKEEWPENWRSLHIPARKKKYMADGKGNTQRVIFWVLNHFCDKAWTIDGKNLGDELIESIPNGRYPEGEYFYNIPISELKLVKFN